MSDIITILQNDFRYERAYYRDECGLTDEAIVSEARFEKTKYEGDIIIYQGAKLYSDAWWLVDAAKIIHFNDKSHERALKIYAENCKGKQSHIGQMVVKHHMNINRDNQMLEDMVP